MSAMQPSGVHYRTLTHLFNTNFFWECGQWPLFPVLSYFLITFSLLSATVAHASEPGINQTSGITFSISVRTPEQIRAFYTGRGFPEAAILELESKCLLTVGMQNNRQDIVWLEPSKWRFVTGNGTEVPRVSRDEWTMRWTKLNIPLASRATFGWTQLPESRDLYPGETAGGNIVVVPPADTFTVEAIFETAANKNGAPIKFKSAPLRCGNPSGASK